MTSEEALIDAVRVCFYEVVPHGWRSYCSLTSRIARDVLAHFDLAAELAPVQLWYAGPSGNCVVGFVDRPLPSEKWNGHAVCLTPNCLLDTATSTLTRSFGIQVPWAMATRRFKISSNAVARIDVSAQAQLWWFVPPEGFERQAPEEPRELIAQCVEDLIRHVDAHLIQREEKQAS
jgi:hypothetical protein